MACLVSIGAQSVNNLLQQEARGSQHGKTAILQLTELEEFELLFVSGLLVERIPSEVGSACALEEGEGLDSTNSKNNLVDSLRSLGVNFGKGSKTSLVGVEDRVVQVVERLDKETKSGKHGHTSVLFMAEENINGKNHGERK